MLGILCFIIACSTKRNSFISRNSHALSTKYNILYNGGLALDAGINELKGTYYDNYWEVLPVERMQRDEAEMMPGQTKNPNFERAEEKAIKAIQKHSMNIGGSEKNPQMDEAHLMLGKARYYDKRYVPALEAFNYVLYKYPTSDKIHEVKVWREKTNMRMENDALAVKNLRKLLSEIKFKDQIYADANAALAQAFLNLQETDSAVVRLRRATEFTKSDEEKARYRFITGQLYDGMGLKDSAYAAYQDVIDMNRNSPRMYVIQSHARQAKHFDYVKGDTLAFTEKFNELLRDRENRPHLDVLNHEMALFYDTRKKPSQAKVYYNKSLDAMSQDAYLNASNYRNLADIYFDEAKYVTAGKYFDSTMVHLKPRTREFNLIRKKRENLTDVIKYEGIATRNDSILNVLAMSDSQQVAYYEEYISKLKKEDEEKAAAAEKERIAQENRNAGVFGQDDIASAREISSASRRSPSVADVPARSSSGKPGSFYFYNPSTVAFGKTEFRKNWGDRPYVPNWRTIKGNKSSSVEDETAELTPDQQMALEQQSAVADARYTPEFYISQLPTSPATIDSLGTERNFAYYQLGVIYKEKFKEYQRAADKLEALLQNNPEERLVLPSLYNLYKIYEIIDPSKMTSMKQRILSQYPESRYAQIISNTEAGQSNVLTPEEAYNNLFKEYEKGDYRNVLEQLDIAVDQYTGEEIASKFELLKAHTTGKLKGLQDYKAALNYVALSYPNQDEGKQAERILREDVPWLEYLQFNASEPMSWKILYRSKPGNKDVKALQDKLKKFISERTSEQLSQSYDIYTMDDDFVVIHGIHTEESAKGIATVLAEYKDYKIKLDPIVISSDNYKIVQIKKNLEEYLADPKKPAVEGPPPVINKVQQQKVNEAPIQPRAGKAAPATRQDAAPPTPNYLPPGSPGSTPAQPTRQQPSQSMQPPQEVKKR